MIDGLTCLIEHSNTNEGAFHRHGLSYVTTSITSYLPFQQALSFSIINAVLHGPALVSVFSTMDSVFGEEIV